MDLKQKVNELIERGKAIKEANPELESLRFEIKDLQYAEIKEAYPDKSLNTMSGDRLHVLLNTEDWDIAIFLITVPLKLKTTIEVINQ